MKQLRNSTLVFLIEREENTIVRVCLAMKKRGFGKGRWNGVGGKVEEGETIEIAARREAQEEIGVDLEKMEKVAELSFYFPHNPAFDQQVHVYFCDDWKGEPIESEEMSPLWFTVIDIPYKEMWADDEFWLPRAILQEKIQAEFTFGVGDIVEKQNVEVVTNFS
jgi:mutator protein MutT